MQLSNQFCKLDLHYQHWEPKNYRNLIQNFYPKNRLKFAKIVQDLICLKYFFKTHLKVYY